MLPEEME